MMPHTLLTRADADRCTPPALTRADRLPAAVEAGVVRRAFSHPAWPEAAWLCLASDFAAARTAWRSLESAWATPYQSLDWVEAAHETFDPLAPVIGWIEDGSGAALMMLPLGCEEWLGARRLRFYGRNHCNYALPLLGAGGAPADAGLWRSILLAMARHAGADIVHLMALPEAYLGKPNPVLALPHKPSANNAYEAALFDAHGTATAILSRKRVKGIQRKMRRLASHGTVRFAATAGNGAHMAAYDAHTVQKSLWFARLGIFNEFATADIRRFFAALARGCGDQGHGTLRFFTLSVDDTIVSVIGLITLGRQASCMILSSDRRMPWASASPGQIALLHMQEWCRAEGFAVMDLGLGHADYKTTFANQEVAMHDLALAATWRGLMMRPLAGFKRTLKRAIKRQRQLWRLAQLARRAVPQMRPLQPTA